ncbi:hypothetical protein ARMSODRAFT_959109 [Armillaria solidipes]|uniref:Uncharacterized protein n=1 Tax=Armillaria solidipes TaxID=1076256 RepID=A0A2H3BWU1_9AGAR|nr:hypothetical protein ARMSODRAFT_959109 [Armillaria solidipes]
MLYQKDDHHVKITTNPNAIRRDSFLIFHSAYCEMVKRRCWCMDYALPGATDNPVLSVTAATKLRSPSIRMPSRRILKRNNV